MIKELTLKKTVEFKVDTFKVWDALINHEKLNNTFLG